MIVAVHDRTRGRDGSTSDDVQRKIFIRSLKSAGMVTDPNQREKLKAVVYFNHAMPLPKGVEVSLIEFDEYREKYRKTFYEIIDVVKNSSGYRFKAIQIETKILKEKETYEV